jgi:hypothetical protein
VEGEVSCHQFPHGSKKFHKSGESESLPLRFCQPLLNPLLLQATFEQLFDMATDDLTNLQRLFARAFKKLHAQMGREEMGKFCLAISKNEKFLTGKGKLKFPMDLESTEIVKDLVPEQRPRKRKRALDKSERLDITVQNLKKNAVSNIKSLIEGHWRELSTESLDIISYQPESDQPIRILCLN